MKPAPLAWLQSLTDTPQQALTRQLDAMLVEAVALGASYENVLNWYVLQRRTIRDQAEAARQAEQEAAAAARQAFEARTLGMVQALTDSPEQALARQRNELLAEAETLGAGTNSITRWYELQTQAIRDQAAAQREAEAEARSAFEARMPLAWFRS